MENTVEILETSVEEVTPVSAEQSSSASISIEEEDNAEEIGEEEGEAEMPEDSEESESLISEEESEEESGEEE